MSINLNFKTLGQGTYVCILHGLFGSSDNWMRIAKNLEDAYQLIIPDLRNHGQSAHSNRWNYDVMAEDVLQLLDQEQMDKVHIIGHSLGGKLAMKFATLYPDRLSRLIVVDIAPRYYKVHHRTIIDGMKSIDIEHLKSRKEAEDQLSAYIPNLQIRQFLLKNLERTPEGFRWKLNLPVIDQLIEHVGEAIIPENIIYHPTLFIKGENSDYITEKDVEDIKTYFEKAEIKTISGAGHWVHAEQPETFVQTVKEFLG